MQVAVVGDMEKPTGRERVENSSFYFKQNTITLHGAGNEVIAFQVVLRSDKEDLNDLDARVSDMTLPAGSPAKKIPSANAQLFLEHYVTTDDASYSWGPNGGAGALPWKGVAWPDALVPFTDPWTTGSLPLPVAAPFSIHPKTRPNQALWIDIFIPKNQPAGEYRGSFEITQKDQATQNNKVLRSIPLTLTVHPFSLPDETHTDGFGELYRETGVMFDAGVKFKQDPARAWPVYRRYLQMAHAHRFLAVHRAGEGPLPLTTDSTTSAPGTPAARPADRWSSDWRLYSPYVQPILDGSLFTAKESYVGPCAGAAPSFFPAPFVETFYGATELRRHMKQFGGSIDPFLLATWRDNAAAFWREVQARGWTDKRFFAYIMDEVDGEQDTGEAAGRGDANADATLFHHAMRQIQQALDEGTKSAGAGQRAIHLLWTSHADPARWVGTPADLRGAISWWAPNGHALDLDFFRPFMHDPAQNIWFYHSGQPAVGNYSINQLGIDLRLWGLLCARYGRARQFLVVDDVVSQKVRRRGLQPLRPPDLHGRRHALGQRCAVLSRRAPYNDRHAAQHRRADPQPAHEGLPPRASGLRICLAGAAKRTRRRGGQVAQGNYPGSV